MLEHPEAEFLSESTTTATGSCDVPSSEFSTYLVRMPETLSGRFRWCAANAAAQLARRLISLEEGRRTQRSIVAPASNKPIGFPDSGSSPSNSGEWKNNARLLGHEIKI